MEAVTIDDTTTRRNISIITGPEARIATSIIITINDRDMEMAMMVPRKPQASVMLRLRNLQTKTRRTSG